MTKPDVVRERIVMTLCLQGNSWDNNCSKPDPCSVNLAAKLLNVPKLNIAVAFQGDSLLLVVSSMKKKAQIKSARNPLQNSP